MPAKPLTKVQLAEAEKLKALFVAWKAQEGERGNNISQEKVVEMLGFGQSAISQYLNGKIPLNINAAIKFADLLGCSVSDFSPSLAEQASSYAEKLFVPDASSHSAIKGASRVAAIYDEDQEPNAVRIRKVKLRLSAGIAGFAIEQAEEDGLPIFFRKDWLDQRGLNPQNLIALKVKGPSMEPGLYEDDTVVINTGDKKPKDGDVYAVNYEGEAVIKRLIRDYGFWWLSSDNPDQSRFPRKRCEGDACIIIGRVIHKQSERI